MSRYDEHGPVEEVERDHGPEWWAMGAELCSCGHRADAHLEAAEGGRFPCGWAEGGIGWQNTCSCKDFAPALDNQ